MTAIGLHGGGKMAEAVFRQACAYDHMPIKAVISRAAVNWAGDIPQFRSLDDLEHDLDVIIDFTLPAGLQSAAKWCAKTGTALLSGTTGLDDETRRAMGQAAETVSVLHSVNLSTGITLVKHLAEEVSRILGEHVEIEIEDTHSVHKKDAPSGTALMLGEAITAIRGNGDIGFSSIREGEEIGRHLLRFKLAGEHIEIVHQANNRSIYAQGALQAADWLASQPIGMYSSGDYLAPRCNTITHCR